MWEGRRCPQNAGYIIYTEQLVSVCTATDVFANRLEAGNHMLQLSVIFFRNHEVPPEYCISLKLVQRDSPPPQSGHQNNVEVDVYRSRCVVPDHAEPVAEQLAMRACRSFHVGIQHCMEIYSNIAPYRFSHVINRVLIPAPATQQQ